MMNHDDSSRRREVARSAGEWSAQMTTPSLTSFDSPRQQGHEGNRND